MHVINEEQESQFDLFDELFVGAIKSMFEVNVLPLNVFDTLFEVPVVGKVSFPCNVKGEEPQNLEFFVADVENTPVLGVTACEKFMVYQ